jgi:putative aldouronate transport system substrate-binding protein
VKKYREESFSKFVLGTRSLGEWNKYVEEINALGVQKLIDTYDAALKRVEQAKLETK